VCLLFLASEQFSLFGLPQGKFPSFPYERSGVETPASHKPPPPSLTPPTPSPPWFMLNQPVLMQVTQQSQSQQEAEASLASLAVQREDLAAQLEACRREVEEGLDALARERHAREGALSEATALRGRLEVGGTKLASASQEVDCLAARCQSLVKDMEVQPASVYSLIFIGVRLLLCCVCGGGGGNRLCVSRPGRSSQVANNGIVCHRNLASSSSLAW